jgi:glycosyltransferase involved in cell wall biosynthesis
MPTAPLFSVVVATRDRSERLTRLLRLLAADDLPWPVEVIVVDDGSTDDTPQAVAALAAQWPSLRYHRVASASGPARARNVGWRSAAGTYVAFTDDDCRPRSGWLAALARGHDTGADIVQGPTLPEEEEYEQRTALSHWIMVEEASYRFETCNISYRRTVLDQLGGFDDSFGTSRGGAPYGEDADLGWRATDAGASFRFVADAVVVHDVVTDGFRRFLARRLRRGSMPYFVRKHPGYRQQLAHGWLMSDAHPPALLAAGGLVLAGVGAGTHAPTYAYLVCAATAVPYVHHRIFRNRVSGRRRMWPVAVAATWVADMVEIGALAAGSVRARTLLL